MVIFYTYSLNMDATKMLLFPDKVCHFAGMTKMSDSYCDKAELVFQTAKSVFGLDLKDIISNGSDYDLNETVHCHAATVVFSLVLLEEKKHRDAEVS